MINGLGSLTKMCLICIELEAEKLSYKEASDNFNEIKETLDNKHKQIVAHKLVEQLWKEYSEDHHYEKTGFGD